MAQQDTFVPRAGGRAGSTRLVGRAALLAGRVGPADRPREPIWDNLREAILMFKIAAVSIVWFLLALVAIMLSLFLVLGEDPLAGRVDPSWVQVLISSSPAMAIFTIGLHYY